jgi:hypothetical protein
MASVGRPASFTQAIADEICRRLSKGESLREICKGEHLPHAGTVLRWYHGSDSAQHFVDFREQYARARSAQAHMLADEILTIADDSSNDWMARKSEAEKGGGYEDGKVLNQDHVQRSRLRIDTRKWYVSKVLPKIYGDKIEHSGDANNPIAVTMIERTIIDPKK